jgi:hypothetical protein
MPNNKPNGFLDRVKLLIEANYPDSQHAAGLIQTLVSEILLEERMAVSENRNKGYTQGRNDTIDLLLKKIVSKNGFPKQ